MLGPKCLDERKRLQEPAKTHYNHGVVIHTRVSEGHGLSFIMRSHIALRNNSCHSLCGRWRGIKCSQIDNTAVSLRPEALWMREVLRCARETHITWSSLRVSVSGLIESALSEAGKDTYPRAHCNRSFKSLLPQTVKAFLFSPSAQYSLRGASVRRILSSNRTLIILDVTAMAVLLKSAWPLW